MAINYGYGAWNSPYQSPPVEPDSDADVYGNFVVNSQYNHYYGPSSRSGFGSQPEYPAAARTVGMSGNVRVQSVNCINVRMHARQ